MARREAINEVRPVLEDLDKVADVVDKGLDAVEKGVDVGVEAIDKGVHVAVEEAHTAVGFVRNPKTAAIILLVVNVAGAGFVGWKLAKRHYTKKFDAELAEQVEEARRYYTRLHKDSDELTPEALAEKYKDDEADAAEAAADALSEYQGAPAAGPIVRPDRTSPRKAYNKPVEVAAEAAVEPEVPIEQNVFVNGSPLNTSDFDLEEELRKRDPEVPYVVTQDGVPRERVGASADDAHLLRRRRYSHRRPGQPDRQRGGHRRPGQPGALRARLWRQEHRLYPQRAGGGGVRDRLQRGEVLGRGPRVHRALGPSRQPKRSDRGEMNERNP
jgi:hypothetical protein